MAPYSDTNVLAVPDIIAVESLRQLYANLVMGGLVYRGFDKEFKKVGQSARVRRPVTFESKVFDPATGIVIQDIQEETIDVVLTTHLDISFPYSSVQKTMYMREFTERYIEPAMIAHADKVDKLLCGTYTFFPTYAGVPGTSPTTRRAFLNARKNLQKQFCPKDNRRFVMGSDTETELLVIASEADKDGSSKALRQASLGMRWGMGTYHDQNIDAAALHTPGTLDPAAGAIDVGVDAALGATSITLGTTGATLTGTLKVGDILEIAGHAGPYTVRPSDAGALSYTAAGNAVTVNIYPALTAAVTAVSNTEVTLLGGQLNGSGVTPYNNDLLFHRNAIVLASAPLESPTGAAHARTVNWGGLAIRIVADYDIHQKEDILSLDLLIGAQGHDERLGTRLVGNDT